ncbi:MAG TPA: GNAT family N-acetyltransferase [Chloroflexia bacterium]|nr:GNAT family N-acetyltransferase [Chloroflexia bacterium]
MEKPDPSRINFQKLSLSDLPLMHQWLNTPFVYEWYGGHPETFENIVQEYTPYIEGREPNDSFLIMYDTIPIGYIQTYKIRDYPEWWQAVQPTEEAAGVDLFIGHPDYIHQGLGGFLLNKFLREIVFAPPEIESCIIDPATANKVAIKAYEKAGFRYWKTIMDIEEDNPDPESHLMRVTRAELFGDR